MINPSLDIQKIKNEFLNSSPNYVVIEDLFDEEFIKDCENEFLLIDDSNFFKYSDPYFEFEKYAMNDLNKMPINLAKLFQFIHSDKFILFVESVTNFSKLFIDDKRWGGGLHKTKPGGYLSIHKDFNVLPQSYKSDKQLLRCVNLIGYLTDENQKENNGHLEFWSEEGKTLHKIENKFNTWILFDTRENFHGHPFPFQGEKSRMSIASYYYIQQEIDRNLWKSTDYMKLPWMEDSEEYRNKRIERSNPNVRYKNLL